MTRPLVLEGGRRALFSCLLLNGFVQAILGLTAVATFDRLHASGFAEPPLVVLLTVLAGGVYVGRILQRRHGEMLALDYVNETRRALLEKVLSLPDARPVSVGLMTTRLSADLMSLKTWLAEGYASSIVAGTTLVVMGIGTAWLYPRVAILLACACAPWILATMLLRPRLRRTIGAARTSRGTLAAMAGEQVIGRLTLAHFGKTRPMLASLSRQGQRLSGALIRRATLSEAMRGATEWALPVASLAGLWLLSGGDRGAVTGAGPLLLLLGTTNGLLTKLSRSVDLHLAGAVAMQRLSSTFDAPSVTQAASAIRPAIARGAAVDIGINLLDAAGETRSFEVPPGAVVSLVGGSQERRSDLLAAMARLRDDPNLTITICGVPAAEIPIRDWRRIVTLSSPRLPLIRNTIRKNLALGAPSRMRIDEVCDLARRFGIVFEPDDLNKRIEPSMVPISMAIALRLCRSLTRSASVILLDETTAASDFPLIEQFVALAQQRRVSVIASGGVLGRDGRPIGEPVAIAS